MFQSPMFSQYSQLRKYFPFGKILIKSPQVLSQPVITCSKLTIETLEQDVKYVIDVILVSLLLTFNKFHALLSCFYY